MRKGIAFLTSLTLIVGTGINETSFQIFNYNTADASDNSDIYDINHDGTVNVLDYSEIVKFFADYGNKTRSAWKDYDLNNDGVCSTLDIISMKEYLINSEIQKEKKHITIDENGLLKIDFDISEYNYDTIQKYLGIKLDEPKDFPYWGYEYKNSDFVYNDIPLCFMFQYDKLIMIIHDSSISRKNSILSSACNNFGTYKKENETQYHFDINANYYLSLYDDFLLETGTNVFKQCYCSNYIIMVKSSDFDVDSSVKASLNPDGSIKLEYTEAPLILTLPSYWKGKFVVRNGNIYSRIAYYSQEINDGKLMTILIQNYAENIPGITQYLGKAGNKYCYYARVTDVRFDMNNKEEYNEYSLLSKDIQSICKSAVCLSPNNDTALPRSGEISTKGQSVSGRSSLGGYPNWPVENGWHITAVSKNVYAGEVWYDCYDTDDGDHYGWIQGKYIAFY